MNLDSIQEIKKYDASNMLLSIEKLSEQVQEIARLVKQVKIPAGYAKLKNAVVMGMGGSALGPHVIRSVFFNQLRMPLEVVNGYHVPAYVNKDSLVVLSSYSGTTEEVLYALKEARKRKAKLLIIASGGELASEAKKLKIPALIFSTDNNPCNQPRMGLGYMIVGQLLLFGKAGVVHVTGALVKNIITALNAYNKAFNVICPAEKNSAKQIAQKTIGHSVWYVASEHLVGNAHIAGNQMNENAKRYGGYFVLPEMNHHLMEGLVKPGTNKDTLLFILIESRNYDARIQKRYDITKDVLMQHGVPFVSYRCNESTKIGEMCELLTLGSYVSFYSAMLENIDPSPIPVVDYFKDQLRK